MTIAMLGENPIGPRVAARLYPEARGAERVAAERPITLRTASNKPIGAVVENLSRTGFAMSTIADLNIGDVIGLSVGGALRRRVRVVRRIGLAYGCEFLSPLSDMEVNAALRSSDAVAADFLSASTAANDAGATRPRKLSYLARAYIVGVAIVILWTLIITFVWRLV